ncbi:MAG: hypothetical protein WDK96_01340 [Candidatus Paceibacterota bacterium]|jgi:hypothetical protein
MERTTTHLGLGKKGNLWRQIDPSGIQRLVMNRGDDRTRSPVAEGWENPILPFIKIVIIISWFCRRNCSLNKNLTHNLMSKQEILEIERLVNELLSKKGFSFDGSPKKRGGKSQRRFERRTIIMTPMGNGMR